jgi:DnaK suppressor protein
VNVEHFKQLLLAKERELVARRARTGIDAQTPDDGAAGDVGDDSVKDDAKSRLFSEDEADAALLDEVRLALGRIADGGYGRCLVDEEPISERRLEAVPWARYCAKHQAEVETRQHLRTPTL